MFQSTPPARGATTAPSMIAEPPPVSIHAPRAGGDSSSRSCVEKYRMFQSTPPARGATTCAAANSVAALFQSTPPARGATSAGRSSASNSLFQSTPPARGATDLVGPGSRGLRFQSTPPARGATTKNAISEFQHQVSIHAPRAGGDDQERDLGVPAPGFNPRPPRGGRQLLGPGSTYNLSFQSTPPARGATSKPTMFVPRIQFQSTPPARGATELVMLQGRC